MRDENCNSQRDGSARSRRRHRHNFQFSIFNFQFAIPTLLSGTVALFVAAGCSDVSEPFVYDADLKSDDKPVTKTGGVPILRPKLDTGQPIWKNRKIDDFSLTERSGRKITRADLLGKPAVVCFIFRHCAGNCPTVTGSMAKLQSWLKAEKIDVRLVTITVDPKRDTPKVLTDYATGFGADKEWWFLTGDEKRIYSLIRDSFGQTVYQLTGENRKLNLEVQHTFAVMLVDTNGIVIGEYDGLNLKAPSMVQLRQRLALWKQTGRFEQTTKPPATPANKVPEPKP